MKTALSEQAEARVLWEMRGIRWEDSEQVDREDARAAVKAVRAVVADEIRALLSDGQNPYEFHRDENLREALAVVERHRA